MINLPRTTIVNRFVSKDKFYSKTQINAKLRDLFTGEVEKIVWTHKIAPSTLNITAGDYPEMQVFEILLKKNDLNPLVLKHIDTFIPYPILYVLTKPGMVKAVLGHNAKDHFETPWQPDLKLKLKGRSVDEIYKNYLHQIAPQLDMTSKSDVKTAIEDNQAREKIIKQINDLSHAIKREPSLAKQQELARQRRSLEQKMLQ